MGKKNVFLYDFQINHDNRGCQALTYGSISFLRYNHNLDNYDILAPGYCFRFKKKDEIYRMLVDSKVIVVKRKYYWIVDIILSLFLCKIFGSYFRLTPFSKDLKNTIYIANISGGDGFSDIYSTRTLNILIWPSLIGCFLKKKVIILPQTIGPFYKWINKLKAHYILKNASKIYVRDLVYQKELEQMNVKYTLTRDVSFYMKPQKFHYSIKPGSVGINISGLAYYNSHGNLKGKFQYYGKLINDIISLFQKNNIPVYLIPHTYNFETPNPIADDLQAAKEIWKSLHCTDNVFVVNENMEAPEVKYVISQCDFFIGTRMHANFAAIYTQTPVFGLAYSYKFKGSFDEYGLVDRYANILDLKEEDIPLMLTKIYMCFNQRKEVREILEKIK